MFLPSYTHACTYACTYIHLHAHSPLPHAYTTGTAPTRVACTRLVPRQTFHCMPPTANPLQRLLRLGGRENADAFTHIHTYTQPCQHMLSPSYTRTYKLLHLRTLLSPFTRTVTLPRLSVHHHAASTHSTFIQQYVYQLTQHTHLFGCAMTLPYASGHFAQTGAPVIRSLKQKPGQFKHWESSVLQTSPRVK